MGNQYLSRKQSLQIIHICERTQTYLPFNEIVFINFLGKIIIPFVREYTAYVKNNTDVVIKILEDNIDEMIMKYYPNGFKVNKYRYYGYEPIICQRMFRFNCDFQEIEKVVFIKTVRACRDFFYSGFKNKEEFVDKLIKISYILK